MDIINILNCKYKPLVECHVFFTKSCIDVVCTSFDNYVHE